MTGRTVRWLLSLVHRRPEPSGARLTIIRHHRVYAAGERPLYRLGVSLPVLESQLGLLAQSGLAPLTVSEGLERLAAGEPGRWVAMSFDDGYADNVAHALPALERHRARATFYLTAGLMERRLAPWWDRLAHALEQARRREARVELGGVRVAVATGTAAARSAALRALLPHLRVAPAEQDRRLSAIERALEAADAAPCALATWSEAARLAERGMEVGAHTLTHPFLSTLDPAAQLEEIAGSRRLVTERLGVAPRGLAYPGGDHDAFSIGAADRAGFDHAVTTRAGDARPGAPRFELRRRGLSEGACLGPNGRFSARLAHAELDGAFDGLRGEESAAA